VIRPPADGRRCPAELYARGLEDRGDWCLEIEGGRSRGVPFGRWLGPATGADEAVLDRAHGPVLDVGCGPGRHVRALARRGVLALGVDASPAAVTLARARGTAVHHGSIFAGAPGPGVWGSALVLDGNLGIGGDPARLLARLAELLRPGGAVLAEVDPPGWPTRPVRARLDGPAGRSEQFAWALVGADGIRAIACNAGLEVEDLWSDGARWFALLR
jgi:SAM-dependent methyltransferase